MRLRQRRSLVLAIIGMLTAFAAPHADATQPWHFGNQDEISPSGRFRFTATWWYEPGKRWPYADCRLTHAFIDNSTGITLWERTSGLEDGLHFVDDSGVAVILSIKHINLVEPLTGELILRIVVEEQLSEQETKDYTSPSTAGPHWQEAPLAGFLHHHGGTYFMLHTWWGRSIIVDVDRACLVEEPSPSLVTAGVQHLVLTTLQAVADQPLPEKSSYSFTGGGRRALALAAIRAAGLSYVYEAVPKLRELEQLEDMPLRATVHVALRRLGETPLVLPCNWPKWHDENAFLTEPRAGRADTIRIGDEEAAVLSAIGCPDFVMGQNLVWEYDMDAPEPYTLRVTWSVGEVEQIEHITPPLWQEGLVRDRLILHQRP